MITYVRCPYCERVLDKRGARLHIASCKKNPDNKTVNLNDLEDVTKLVNETFPASETCEHDYRLLIPEIPLEAEAKRQGYNKICTKCNEIE